MNEEHEIFGLEPVVELGVLGSITGELAVALNTPSKNTLSVAYITMGYFLGAGLVPEIYPTADGELEFLARNGVYTLRVVFGEGEAHMEYQRVGVKPFVVNAHVHGDYYEKLQNLTGILKWSSTPE